MTVQFHRVEGTRSNTRLGEPPLGLVMGFGQLHPVTHDIKCTPGDLPWAHGGTLTVYMRCRRPMCMAEARLQQALVVAQRMPWGTL